MILVLFFTSCFSAAIVCLGNKNTNYYIQRTNNTHFFVLSSFTGYLSPCEETYNNQLQNNSDWIPDDYRVVDIIDVNNGPPELKRCNKNIKGNKIVAHKGWNEETNKLCWLHLKEEKSTVYGEFFYIAYRSVKECCEQQQDYQTLLISLYTAAAGCLLLAVIFFMCYFKYCRQSVNNALVQL